uniref:Uncharacterized protein n=1 Tax=Anguilla anguilla TaxID=7936 RepID=A0A0E9XA63_ANGAN
MYVFENSLLVTNRSYSFQSMLACWDC